MNPQTFKIPATVNRKLLREKDKAMFGVGTSPPDIGLTSRRQIHRSRSSLPTKPRRARMPKTPEAPVNYAEDVVETVMKWARITFRCRQLTPDIPLKTIFPGWLLAHECAIDLGIEPTPTPDDYEHGKFGDIFGAFLEGRKQREE